MTDIRELFEDAVADAPPSKLSAHEVFRNGQTRRRRRAGYAMALAATGVAAVLAGAFALPDVRGPEYGGPLASARVVWAGMADQQHLFMITSICGPAFDNVPPEPFNDCDELYASVDGGRTFQRRGSLASSAPATVEVADRDTLIMQYYDDDFDPQLVSVGKISTDGGRSWRGLDRVDTPVAADDGAVVSYMFSQGRISVVDRLTRSVRPLATQPDIGPAYLQPARGALWASGFDPASNRPAVAVSRDGGRTWTTAELPGAPPVLTKEARGSTEYLAQVVSWDGVRAFATLRPDPGPDSEVTGPAALEFTVPIYRTDDGGATWQPVEPWNGVWANAPMMTADGRLVMVSGAQRRLVYDGERFELTSLPGLPDYVAGDGRIAFDHDAVFGSDDGWTWRELWRSSICRLCRPEPTR